MAFLAHKDLIHPYMMFALSFDTFLSINTEQKCWKIEFFEVVTSFMLAYIQT